MFDLLSKLVFLSLLHIDKAYSSAKYITKSLFHYYKLNSHKKKIYLFGVFSDKEYDKIIEITAPLAEYIYTVETPDNPRALPAEELAREVAKVNPAVEPADSIADAVKKSLIKAGKDDVILVFGSLSFLKQAEEALNFLTNEENL
ncbi:MAG: glutamate ligase domain-containing protein [Muricoprocola sp.]